MVAHANPRLYIGPLTNQIIVGLGRSFNTSLISDHSNVVLKIKRRKCGESCEYNIVSYFVDGKGFAYFEMTDEFMSAAPKGFYDADLWVVQGSSNAGDTSSDTVFTNTDHPISKVVPNPYCVPCDQCDECEECGECSDCGDTTGCPQCGDIVVGIVQPKTVIDRSRPKRREEPCLTNECQVGKIELVKAPGYYIKGACTTEACTKTKWVEPGCEPEKSCKCGYSDSTEGCYHCNNTYVVAKAGSADGYGITRINRTGASK